MNDMDEDAPVTAVVMTSPVPQVPELEPSTRHLRRKAGDPNDKPMGVLATGRFARASPAKPLTHPSGLASSTAVNAEVPVRRAGIYGRMSRSSGTRPDRPPRPDWSALGIDVAGDISDAGYRGWSDIETIMKWTRDGE